MRKPLPVIYETAAELKQRLRRERDGRKRLRLQMLYLFASEQVHTRQELAQVLGLSRNTVGRWLTDYASGGLAELLTVYVAPGKQPSLTPEVLTSIETAVRQPHGFESYKDLQAWIAHTHGLSVKYKTLYTIVRKRFKTKLKVPRPSHTKKD